MQETNDSKSNEQAPKADGELPLDPKQQQSDPNLTELKGFVNKEVPLEPNAKQADKEQ
ncbi:MAG TPA: hypothetical protein VM935_10085 [Chitinophagaceae bacterium]|jgi:hypothetical protein|nr:hypothetical protein [Chitinophagaceae bacterium]